MVWSAFQPKFDMVMHFVNHMDYFERILEEVCRSFVREHIYFVELKHIFGIVIDNEGKSISLEDELKIWERVRAKVKVDCPDFDMKMIVQGLKILGKWHIDLQLE